MSFQIHRLKLTAQTPAGRYGVDITLPSGLVILRGNNSSGKSTIANALLYALGLEGMLSAQHVIPLTPAMTDRLQTPDGTEVPVLESSVVVEIVNSHGEALSIERAVKHPTRRANLVRVWDGLSLSKPEAVGDPTEYYVRLPGAAQEPAGFHRLLAKFAGWSLPKVARRDGSEGLLNIELFFSLLFVEQRWGWAGIHALPRLTYGVVDVRSRAVEFLLGLSVLENVRRRAELGRQLQRLEREWHVAVNAFRSSIRDQGFIAENLPDQMTLSLPLEPEPRLLLHLTTDETPADASARWTSTTDAATLLRSEYGVLADQGMPSAEAQETAAAAELQAAESALQDITVLSAVLSRDLEEDRQQLSAGERQLDALRDDLRKHTDLQRLMTLGAEQVTGHLEECPTCHRHLPDALLKDAQDRPTMALADNIAYLREQIRTFEAMDRELSRSIQAGQERVASLGREARELRARVRAARSTLTSAVGTPSALTIRRMLQIEDRLASVAGAETLLAGLLDTLKDLSVEAVRLKGDLESIPMGALSASDMSKLDTLRQHFSSHLREFGFSSFPPESISVSDETYLPSRAGFDLVTAASASDNIRLIWAYLLALLEVAQEATTNHAGWILFDEPRQQETESISFEALLRRAADSTGSEQQVLVLTSFEESQLRGMLGRSPHHLIPLPIKAMQPLP